MENNLIQTVPTYHQDIVHDICFNYLGTRMATVSSDKRVKIWNKDENGNFKYHSEFKPQDGPIWKVKWALPEFGNVIATCSLDKTGAIYEEKKSYSKEESGQSQTEWIFKFRFQDSKEPIEDIKFGPRNMALGSQLSIALACRDGTVRICKTENDISITQWQTESTINVSKYAVSCISWNKSNFEDLMIAVGIKPCDSYDQENTYQQSTNSTKFEGSINNKLQQKQVEKPCYFYIYTKTQTLGWQPLVEDKEQNYVQDGINDISWVAQNGKDYHQIAICGKFGVKILKFNFQSIEKWDMEAIDILQDVEIWRVSWNIMGTMIACTDSNNQVLAFGVQKSVYEWKSILTIQENFQNQDEYTTNNINQSQQIQN